MLDCVDTALDDPIRSIRQLLAAGEVTALCGAGLSTESGIPAYRGPDGQRRVTPMTVSELLASPEARRRYWARAYVGWQRFASAEPNEGHRAVTALQRAGLLGEIITQNVDGLQQQAGARNVLELHGSLSWVVCVDCGTRFPREDVDRWLQLANPDFRRDITGEVRPDGDVALSAEVVDAFRIAHCVVCGSDRLKPDVVMFGESVAPELVQRCYDAVESGRSLLVLGSSLMVMSGLRFVRRAAQRDIPIAAVTDGITRGDDLIAYKAAAPLGRTLTRLATELGAMPTDQELQPTGRS